VDIKVDKEFKSLIPSLANGVISQPKRGFPMQGLFFDVGIAREFHESESQQQEALSILRRRKLTKVSFERDWGRDESRLAPSINILRKGWGFKITGNGTKKDPYWLQDPNQSPTLVRTTEKIKSLYYDSEHWMEIRERRFQHDNYRCVSCVESCKDSIQCHHTEYNLFSERLDELLTLCVFHHKKQHQGSKLAFPKGVELWMAERLLGIVAYPFEEWLLP
jgi:hypothetical protein